MRVQRRGKQYCTAARLSSDVRTAKDVGGGSGLALGGGGWCGRRQALEEMAATGKVATATGETATVGGGDRGDGDGGLGEGGGGGESAAGGTVCSASALGHAGMQWVRRWYIWRATANPLTPPPSPGSRCKIKCVDKPRFWRMQSLGFVVRCVRMYRSRTYRACCNITGTAGES